MFSCSTSKKGNKTSIMKNLTAHYNIYYNASELLRETELRIRDAHRDNYNLHLAIFPLIEEASAANEEENLNIIIEKANRIALEKYESKWVDDAFILLAKAEYLKGNYFNSVEYFTYVIQSFPTESKNKLESQIWLAKSYFALDEEQKADSILKIASNSSSKHHKDLLNAAIAQAYINSQELDLSINHLKKAINSSKNRYDKIRWTFILAQLQESNNQINDAYKSYEKVAKSNASFEMSFNANLAKIRLEENENGLKFDKISTLKKLLKEDKNKEFKDQIYYQIAEAYTEQGDLNLATEYYEKSAWIISGTTTQKGLSYLKLAELNFDTLKNYSKSQLYYDSTLQFLPKEYPDYKIIAKKTANLQYLADRLILIEKEQELLKIASLTEEERIEFIDKKVEEELNTTNNLATNMPELNSTNISKSQNNAKEGTFYFNNSMAISQGLQEFKTKWGNRKLEDNWRISSSMSKQQVAPLTNTTDPFDMRNAQINASIANRDSIKNAFAKSIPLNKEQQIVSYNKIKNARYDIALFYKDILKDDNAAGEVLEDLILNNDKNDPQNAEIFYQLYRTYASLDPQKSENYKNLLLQVYPQSIYAKSINTPSNDKNTSDINTFQKDYETIFNLYQTKNFTEVIKKINALEPYLKDDRRSASRFAYLKTLAIGHTQKTPEFINSLEEFIETYSNDLMITPIAKNQLEYIQNNRDAFNNRKTALLSYDENEIISKPIIVNDIPKETQNLTNTTTNELVLEKDLPKQAEEKKEAENVIVAEPEKPKAIVFTSNPRVAHSIVINIKNASLNIAKPFASLNKYFYSKFDPSNVNLTIRTIGNTNKLIIIKAKLNSLPQAENALKELELQLDELLGIQSSEYNSFIISESNLLLVKDSESLNQYLNYIK
jgi:tetratricopeptide (TPR) repeat protein